MNRSIRSLLRVSAFASSAAVLGLAVASVRTGAGEEPASYAVRNAAGPAAPAGAMNGGPQRAVTGLGTGAVKESGLRMSSSGVVAKCAATAGRAVRAPIGPATGGRVGRLPTKPPGLPVGPPADYHVPVHDPNAVLMLSKQVSDPFGGMTLTGASVDTSPGTPRVVREFGAARCDALRRTSVVRPVSGVTPQAQRRDLTDPVTSLSAATGGLTRPQAGRPGDLLGLSHLTGKPRASRR
ncbi:hypothetical protein [Actinomadura sp. HBU206391]|uniref:hypothetical protein n=1 Tax=Actinomadura sp. HBU206391 TaxID=2731692 RepID=UPI0016506E1B|nr:hypothetical protein [Actinomadura sp. HBU206391]MBC6460965.1 hypothetical protein [Actinomadura sp. HBU206391]